MGGNKDGGSEARTGYRPQPSDGSGAGRSTLMLSEVAPLDDSGKKK